MNGTDYAEFRTDLNHEEFYFDVDDDVKLHGVLFKPDSIASVGTIFHYSGKGMHLMSSIQESYKPLLKKGFQIFCFERRNFGKSNGDATNSLTLKKDALFIFDEIIKLDNVVNKPILIWGQSLGGAFASMNASERQEKIKGLVLEGTFSSFPDIGKVYANALNLENFKWIVPLIMNNDFPTEENIKKLTIPTVILHSKSDKQVPYELGKKIFEKANKNNTRFWDIDSKHIMGIYDYEEKYVGEFIKMIEK
ncbi:alpha/beta hydrolase [Aquimarina hainanensis]|uniref:Alpha/beta hydrolase n=1 Tax=Aquimarina hainanensis TaxID=1578017 RepID=A0ABW5N4Z6_9FLAO|nr:alpha/beta fold hydrolase [Aquimarina sp. TRL1]QKX06179.1 alpha/beta fold hydrolase [Aquimarina sp. TRL1]